MMQVQEILEQLEFEKTRHIKMSELIEDFEISTEHLDAATRIKRAIKIIKCTLLAKEPTEKERGPNSNSQTFGNIEDPEPLSYDTLQGMNSQTVYVAMQCDGGADVIIPALVACNTYSDDDPDEVYLTNNLGGRCTYGEVLKEGGTVYARKPNVDRKASKEFYSTDKKA